MGISTSGFTSAVNKLLAQEPEIVAEEVIRSFCYLGEWCVGRIRDRSAKASWYDQTGNLRSSVGYAVYHNGNLITKSSFKQVKDGKQGTLEGEKALLQLSSKYAANEYALIIVAGMEYAEYVEAMENKDVLASTELLAKSQLPQYIAKAIERANGRILQMIQQLGL